MKTLKKGQNIDIKFGGEGVGGLQITLCNLQGWSGKILILPYKGRYMVQKSPKIPLRN